MKEAMLRRLEALLDLARQDEWVADDPEQQGIASDLDSANTDLDEPFAIESSEGADGLLVLELRPRREFADPAVIEPTVYRLLGLVAERNVFVHRRLEQDRFVFDVVIGDRLHGHFVRLIVHAPGLKPYPGIDD